MIRVVERQKRVLAANVIRHSDWRIRSFAAHNKVIRRLLSHKEVEREKGLAANVYPQDELRGVKEVITALFPA
jgi:hypothetical protein